MIKRRFYKDEHADRNDVSDSSSSSDDESDSTKEDEEEEEEETIVVEKPNSPTLGSFSLFPSLSLYLIFSWVLFLLCHFCYSEMGCGYFYDSDDILMGNRSYTLLFLSLA